jgi:hypothetical protein
MQVRRSRDREWSGGMSGGTAESCHFFHIVSCFLVRYGRSSGISPGFPHKKRNAATWTLGRFELCAFRKKAGSFFETERFLPARTKRERAVLHIIKRRARKAREFGS